MKILFFILLSVLSLSASYSQELPPLNQAILEAIGEMPTRGGYVLTSQSAKQMNRAFSWSSHEKLELDPKGAVPSYCTTATYLVFYRALQRHWSRHTPMVRPETLALLKPNLESDGLRVWGRWNSNGPGTAKFFHDTQIGTNFDDIERALPGDFLKLFWNEHVGKLERGHSVVYLGRKFVAGVEMIQYWSSNKSTDGYGAKWIPRSDAVRLLFSRLDRPENLDAITAEPVLDKFLASMLTVESKWSEVRRVSGF